MSRKKRALEGGASGRKAKKAKSSSGNRHEKSQGEHSFTGDSAMTAEERFERRLSKRQDKGLLSKPKVKRKSSNSRLQLKPEGHKRETLRIEHLNYKRIVPGMKILGQVVSVHPLAIVVSLPNQLVAHVPITKITSQLSRLLESMDLRSDASGESASDTIADNVPDLSELFHAGQYVRAVVANVRPPGATDMTGLIRSRDEVVKASRRVELSLIPEEVNAGVRKSDLKDGYTMSAAVQSIEDHGYILDLGISGVSGFLSFKDAHKEGSDEKLRVGCLVDIAVLRLTSNGRTCNTTSDLKTLATTSVSEVSDVTSVLPGTLVESLVTGVTSNGLNLQILGFFDATADKYHQSRVQRTPKVGQKLKARVLYNIPGTSPPRFSVSLSDHHLGLGIKSATVDLEGPSLVDAFPIGTILESVKISHVEPEQGLLVEVQPSVDGFVHISQVSDEHTPILSETSGPWKISTLHKARVIGYHIFDGILQLSLRPSVFLQKFLQVGDIQVGEVIKGTVKRLTDSAVFVSLSERLDGVIWPNHYADVPLKYPAKRFKVGANIKCRVLTVEPERNRVVLTAKRTLMDTSQPILTSYEDTKIGTVTHGVIFAVSEKGLKVEFFNNLKATIPAGRQGCETGAKLTEAFTPGKVTKVRIIAIHKDTRRIVASIRQATSAFAPTVTDVSSLSVGDTVQGAVVELQKANIVLSLRPSEARAHLSFVTLANIRGTTVSELRTSLKPGVIIDSLIVTSVEEGFVIVGKPESSTKTKLSMDTVAIGQIVRGRVTRHGRSGAQVKLTARITGSLHPTDACDDYEVGNPFPASVGIDKSANHLTLSTRPSNLSPDAAKPPVDRELSSVEAFKVGDTVRGFIKSVSEHGLFVMIGRGIDARYIKDWKSRFVANQLVRGRILSVDIDNMKVEMTFRSGDLARNHSKLITFSDLQEGQKVTGRVKRIEQYGLFILIDDSKVSGLCHKSELSDNKDADVTVALRTFREGDRVKAIILSPVYFAGDEDVEVTDNESLKGDRSSASEAEIDEENDLTHISEESMEENSGDDTENDSEDELPGIGIENAPEAPSISSQRRQPLKLEGFRWFSNDAISEEDSATGSSSEDETETRKKKRKKRKEIQQDVTAEMHTKIPESSADFERLLLGSPNSSYMWIQYMSFYLQMSEIDKARATGRRAVQTISFREEQERLNVWIALLNIENTYGSDATMESVFKDAARHNDSKAVHLRLAAILKTPKNMRSAEEQYKRTCKKFGQSSKVWTLFAEHYLRCGRLEEARKLLSRSLQSLEKRKHIKTISKFAQLEYKLGDAERGRTIFEGIVDSHPKRWDLWSIYVDMEVKQGDIQHLRNIFSRVLAIKMTSHKAKSFFKKWLNLEHKLGDDEGAAAVKQRAIEWTQQAAATS
ncbi:hypothetical protein EDD15DRAFT_2209398 [Pisolithus albus]|nr:hypothetical protein EDD15DRAFT_2209398 [Pisolithus albus]